MTSLLKFATITELLKGLVMEAAIKAYQRALIKQQSAEAAAEELRAKWSPYLTKRVVTMWEEDEKSDNFGEPTNWQEVLTKDKAVLKTHKKFGHRIQEACALSTKTNLARREMIKMIDAAA